jgi:mercuric ion transport protein
MENGTTTTRSSASLVAGLLAALGASACCFAPLALVALGVGGAWAGRLQRLEPLQPCLDGLALAFVGLAFHRLYMRPRRCAEGEACEPPAVPRRRRAVFRLAAVVIAAIVAIPFLA